jgi:hypothetical protein
MGIGSSLKKAVRKIIPNEIAEAASVAAPFVAPFNPAVAAAMAGLGSFDQTGRIGSSVRAGLGTYALGQGARMLGGAGFQKGFGGGGGLGSYFTSPFSGGQLFGAVGPQGPVDPIFGGTGETKFFTGGDSNLNRFIGDAGTEAASQVSSLPQSSLPAAEGGQSVITSSGDIVDSVTGEVLKGSTTDPGFLAKFKAAKGGDKLKIVYNFMTDPKNKMIVSALGGTAAAVLQYLENKGAEKERSDFALFRDRPTDFYNLQYRGGQQAKDGGIIGLANGGEPAMEMDYRGGGFIPVGAKERADDVPARLSKNEFVMTADAVRAAGGGSVDVGAQRMYDLMNRLEAQA